MKSDKDTKFLYNKIVNLEVITETILELLIENGNFTEKDFEERIHKNVEVIQNEMKRVMEELNKSNEEDEKDGKKDSLEGLKRMYWGDPGEA